MRCRWIVTLAAMGAWLVSTAVAQPADTGVEDTQELAISLNVQQNGESTTSLEKGNSALIIATVDINMPEADKAVVQVALNLSEDLDIDNADDVLIRRLYIDNTGEGNFALQSGNSIRPRLGFTAPEGETGIVGTQVIKWEVIFKNNTAGSPLTATAAVSVPPSNDIVDEASATKAVKVRTALSVQQLWADGGIFMWPLGLALILGIAFALERAWTLTWAKVNAEKFFEMLAAGVRAGGADKAIEVCDTTRGPVAAVIREGLLRVNQGVDHVEKAITSAGAVEGSFLQRGMVVLASVTTIAPLMGFLGTVWGMVLAFKSIAEAGDVKPSVVADGISQALITTAAGLVIAIIIQTFHNFLISRINRIVIDMEETSTKLVDLLIEQGLDERASA
jgi:biopolymer transport protein ExbB